MNVAAVEFAKAQLLLRVIVSTSPVALDPETAQPTPVNPDPRVTLSDVPVMLVKDVGHITVIVLPEPAVKPFAKSKPIVHVEVAVACNEPAEKDTLPRVMPEVLALREKFTFESAANPADDDCVVFAV